MACIDLKQVVYVDESGIDEKLIRQYGRALRGREVPGEVSGQKANRISMIAALNQKEIKAPFRFEGYTNTEVFNGECPFLDRYRLHERMKPLCFVNRLHRNNA